ncbi:ribosome-binding factor A, partial [Staphylococcus saprophyticus]|uniref:ribosome-binding factor A n=1 Tax=Staphylococcus saprophyticus TaxID=29385 RepID=UPI003703FFA4
TNHLSIPTLYLTLLPNQKQKPHTFKPLQKPKAFIKSQLRSRMRLPIIPQFNFQYHQSIHYPNKIQTMIHHLHKKH